MGVHRQRRAGGAVRHPAVPLARHGRAGLAWLIGAMALVYGISLLAGVQDEGSRSPRRFGLDRPCRVAGCHPSGSRVARCRWRRTGRRHATVGAAPEEHPGWGARAAVRSPRMAGNIEPRLGVGILRVCVDFPRSIHYESSETGECSGDVSVRLNVEGTWTCTTVSPVICSSTATGWCSISNAARAPGSSTPAPAGATWTSTPSSPRPRSGVNPFDDDPEFMALLGRVAANKPANSDMYTAHLADFVETFARVLGDPGAAPPVLRRGRRARGGERAEGARSTGRAGTTRPRGRDPRARHQGAAPHPRLPRPQRLHAVADQHRPDQDRPLPEVRLAADRRAPPSTSADVRGGRGARRWPRPGRPSSAHPHDIACFIAEPIQGEGGDNHMRPEFLRPMQRALPRARRAVRLGRGADRRRAHRHAVGVPAARPRARHRGLRQEGPGRRHHGRPQGGRGAGQRVPGQRPDQLHLGRRPGRHGPLPPDAGDHRARRPDRARRRSSATTCSTACASSRRGFPDLVEQRPRARA